MPKDDFRSPLPAPEPPPLPPEQRPTPAPPWVAFVTAWLGLFTLIAALIVPFLPGSRNPQAELEQIEPYAPADWFIPVPLYAAAVVFFLGIIVFWQMRQEPRPLPAPMLAQRLQASVGMVLAFIATAFIYVYVAFWGGPG